MRNTSKRGYRFKQAQQLTENRRLAATKSTKMTHQYSLSRSLVG
jgi:hypothetical protein